jgi:hypothetical protein
MDNYMCLARTGSVKGLRILEKFRRVWNDLFCTFVLRFCSFFWWLDCIKYLSIIKNNRNFTSILLREVEKNKITLSITCQYLPATSELTVAEQPGSASMSYITNGRKQNKKLSIF